MILSKGELKMIRAGRNWFRTSEMPSWKPNQVVRLRSSGRDKGFLVTVSSVTKDGDYRVSFRLGDCVDHPRFLAPTGDSSGGFDSDRGYTDDPGRAMDDRDQWGQPLECVSDWWLKRFGS